MDSKHNLAADLLDLSQLDDRNIDTSEIPVRTSFEGGHRARYFDLRVRDYDVRAIANWCIERATSENIAVTSLWLNKIVYFVYEKALQEFRVLLTPAKVEAWDHGPVFREIYYELDKENPTFLKMFDVKMRKKVLASADFVTEDLIIFNSVWNRFGRMSASELRNISHNPGSPWHVVWTYRGKTNPGMVIDTTTILGHTANQRNGRS